MIAISDHRLRVELLDPQAPHPAHGNRYCHGGYIWQVHDAQGPLLSGPEYPHPTPTAFNGQGLPEVFRHADKQANQPLTQRPDGEGLIIGIGRCRGGFTPTDVVLTSTVSWSVVRTDSSATFTSQDQHLDWAYHLTRRVALEGGELLSATTLRNAGNQPLPLQWYAHPFFAHRGGLTTCRFPDGGVTVPSNPAYAIANDVLAMRADAGWNRHGHFQWLDLRPGLLLEATLSHPRLDGIRIRGDFPIDRMPVWANSNTLSIEPYLRADLAPGQTLRWSLRYGFGASG